MTRIRGLTVSVGYDDILRLTLPRNMRHLAECLVITSPDDRRTQDVAAAVAGVTVFTTDAFTRHGARFNKGLAFEEAFDAFGRHGSMLIWDADCLFPDALPFEHLHPNSLHGCKRRILEDPRQWHPGFDWQLAPVGSDNGPIGYFQWFDADSPVIQRQRPWYDPTFAHAGGGDAYFMQLWPPNKRRMLPMQVLHLGPRDSNWFGRATPRLDGEPVEGGEQRKDVMDAFLVRNGWMRSRRNIDATAVHRVSEVPHRVDVPGAAQDYELPFVKRARGRLKPGR